MKDQIQSLIAQLNEYRDAYYNRNESLISDREYDLLYDKLAELESKTGVVYANSPTQTVGYKTVSSLKKVKHSHPLLSLGKTTDINEFTNYFVGKDMVLMAKMDGLTASLTYRDGKLVLAESRGNGEIGEDITHNALTFCNLPLEIPYKGELIVDGECIIDYKTFAEINEKEHTEYKNPRNLASGTVRQLDNSVCLKRKVKFIAWRLPGATGSFDVSLTYLSSLGFDVVPRLAIYGGNGFGTQDYISLIRQRCKENGFPIDGIVGTFDSIDYGNTLGSTGHHPKHSLAFKFYQEDSETILRDIEWNVSRTGMVNPVAVFDPVEIDGTTVERASLSNVSIIKNLQIGIGDNVTVIKSNQIIPYIRENLTRSGTYLFPKKCPCCGSDLELRNDNGSEMLFCNNNVCDDIVLDRLSYFVGREGMNVAGLSRERLRQMLSYGFVKTFRDIYELKNNASYLISIPGFGESSVNKLLSEIESSRKCKFSNVLVAIGIPGIGKSTAKDLAKECTKLKYGNILRDFCYAAKNHYDWSVIPGFGATMNNAINQYVGDNMYEILALQEYLIIAEDNEQDTDKHSTDILGGKNFCITGKLIRYPNRDSLVEDIEAYGGKVVSGVTAKTDYLITNDKESGSSKNEKAKKFGTKIINESEFINMIGR